MNSQPPSLPTAISSDGREVWAWAAALSAHTQRVHKMAELRREIARTGTRCGDCDKWMKSRECPMEHNVNGQSRGPSCEGLICKSFVEASSATKFRAQRQSSLDALVAEHQAPPPTSPDQEQGR